jgi:hypothetical protein
MIKAAPEGSRCGAGLTCVCMMLSAPYQGTLLMTPARTRTTKAMPMMTDHQSSLICFHQGADCIATSSFL